MPPIGPALWWRDWRQTALPVAVTLVPAGPRAWPTSSRARRRPKSKTACSGSSARVGRRRRRSRRPLRGKPRRRAARRRPARHRQPAGRRPRPMCSPLQHAARAGRPPHLHAAPARLARDGATCSLAPMPSGAGLFYYVLAAVGIFTLLVGAAVRARRPTDQATLHFFWLSVAFFGALHVLVQRPSRSRGLGLLLGRRRLR